LSSTERPRPTFAHPAEEALALILDFYGIEWEYEPRTFPLEWDEQGNVVEAFTPDFYLPQQALYLEITTLRQPLVTRKNRKLRRFRELYPEKTVILLYRGDLERLGAKYSRRAPRALPRFHALVG